MTFVLDTSVTLAWCFEDEATPYTESVLERMKETNVVVPPIWGLEVANALLNAERGARHLQRAQTLQFVEKLASLPVQVAWSSPERALGPVLETARLQKLTSYDASYLELAMREDLPLATLDRALQAAARRAGVQLLE